MICEGDNVYVVPFDELEKTYREDEMARLCIPESNWRELEGKRGVVLNVREIDNMAFVAFPAVEECEGSSIPIILYFRIDTLEKIPFGPEE